MLTVRGMTSAKDGQIHADSRTKLVTVLIYLNSEWTSPGGRLRLLRSADDVEDMAVEVPPVDGNLVAFKVGPNSWHGHPPAEGVRRSVQLNWVTDEGVVRREERRHRLSAAVKGLFG
jgi:Rps23 Pro-64 3,4-dihydroxylase Tpa1-like proline 4-hydroxylase